MISKSSKNSIKLQSVLESDRLKVSDAFFDTLLNDLTTLLIDYLDLSNTPILKIEKTGKGFEVKISALATRLKNVSIINKREYL
ncbi:MAG: hypothetical protein J6B16_02645 [Clostridia bacterium]|nr:hypothetical protein [Clostridia bacterium]